MKPFHSTWQISYLFLHITALATLSDLTANSTNCQNLVYVITF